MMRSLLVNSWVLILAANARFDWVDRGGPGAWTALISCGGPAARHSDRGIRGIIGLADVLTIHELLVDSYTIHHS